jgi:gamma-glutamylcyclotransferase (GGCT)/AIG2-like uncharacterized protein YtfP
VAVSLLLEREDDAATPLLFVYGTLRRDSHHPMSRLLALHADYLGAGQLNGRLYRLGRYPGAVISQHPSDWVRGDIYAMKVPQALLARMDRYEGLDIGRRRLGEYQRAIVAIRLDDGSIRQAWVYLYKPPIKRIKRMVTGDYLRQWRRSPERCDWRVCQEGQNPFNSS